MAVSGFTILIGSVGRYFITLNQRHPNKDATCIDYGLSNVMLPTVLIGSMTGVLFNMLLPPLILQICLTVLLIVLTLQSYKKTRQIFRTESEAEIKAIELKSQRSEEFKADINASFESE